MTVATLKRPTGEPKRRGFDDSMGSVEIDNMVNEQTNFDSEGNENPGSEHSKAHDTATTIQFPNESEQDVLETIIKVFEGPADWRNAWGLGQDAGYSTEVVSRVIENNIYLFDISPLRPAGIKFYRLRPTE